MSSFYYQGKDKQGIKVEGYIEALSDKQAANHLFKLEVTPLVIKEASLVSHGDILANIPFINSVKSEDLLVVSQQMYSLLKAKVPVIQALKVILDSSLHKKIRYALRSIILDLESGYNLARSFQNQTDVFPFIFVAMIEVGEYTGKLSEAFKAITHYLEVEIKTIKRVQAAFRYPLMVFSAILVAMGVINFLVVPVFKDFFDSFGAELPIPTKILVVSSNFCIDNWLWLLIGGGLIILSFFSVIKEGQGKYQWDRFKLKLPIIGSILQRALLARFSRSLAMAHETGVPILLSLELVANTTNNKYITEKILGMRAGLERGDNFLKVATNTKIFSPLVLQMLAVGEQTGQFHEMLTEVADFYESNVDYDLKRLGDLLEPMLIIIIAILVLILALGVFLPMWDLSSVAMQSLKGP